MKKTIKLFAILFAFAGLSTLFTSCDSFFTIMVSSNPEKLVIRDDTASLSDTEFKVSIYKTDNEGERLYQVLSQRVSVSKYDNAIINLSGKMFADSYYEITIETTSNRKSIIYSTYSPNLAVSSSDCFIKPKTNCNYRLNLKTVSSSTYKFEIEELSKY